MKRNYQPWAATFGLLALAAFALAAGEPSQQAEPSRPAATPSGGAMHFNATDINGPLVRWLSVGNNGEIQLGQFAQRHSRNERVRQFAQMMVNDHTQFAQKIQQAAGREAGAAGPQGAPTASGRSGASEAPSANRVESDVSRPAGASATVGPAGPAGQSTQAGPAGMAGALDLLRLKEQCGQNKLALIQRELERHQGADFDRAYVGQQIMAHTEMLADLQAARTHATGGLQQAIDEGIETTQKHLDHARQLMQQLTAAPAAQPQPAPQ